VPQRGSGIAEAILLRNADFSKYSWEYGDSKVIEPSA